MTAAEFAAQHEDEPWTAADCETHQNLAAIAQPTPETELPNSQHAA